MISCKKGDTGPQGAQGAQGPAGQTGAQGPTGSANVIYSSWMTVNTWTLNNFFGIHTVNFRAKEPKLTKGLLDTAVILGYLRILTNLPDQTFPLPWNDASDQVQFEHVDSIGSIDFDYFSIPSPSTYPIILGPGTAAFRYIIIPGGVKASNSSGSSPQKRDHSGNMVTTDGGYAGLSYSQMSYAEICDRFGIPK